MGEMFNPANHVGLEYFVLLVENTDIAHVLVKKGDNIDDPIEEFSLFSSDFNGIPREQFYIFDRLDNLRFAKSQLILAGPFMFLDILDIPAIKGTYHRLVEEKSRIKELFDNKIDDVLIQEGHVRIISEEIGAKWYKSGEVWLRLQIEKDGAWLTHSNYLYKEINFIYSEDDVWFEYNKLC